MAFITAEIKCAGAARSVPVRLYYPTDLPDEVGNEIKGVITLLHGMGNTGADWMMMSAAPRYAADNGYVLVAPDASNSFYTDMAAGAPFYSLLTGELMDNLHKIFKLPAEREKNFLCGLSMGGYGALRIGLSQPGRYAALGSFSGCVDMRGLVAATQNAPIFEPIWRGVFGTPPTVPEESDLFTLVQRANEAPQAAPRILLTCGRQDALVESSRALDAVLGKTGLSHEYLEWDGVHEWNFWDRSLAHFISFVQGSGYAQRKQSDWA